MPSTEDAGGGRDFQLTKEDRLRLEAALVEMYPTEASAWLFLEEIRFPRERVPLFRSPQTFWRDVFIDLDSGILPEPYRRLRQATEPHKVTFRLFDEIFRPYEASDAQARRVADRPTETCHAIVWTETERERTTVRRWLETEGLKPWEVWRNSEMTSFGLSEIDATLAADLINNKRPDLLFKIIPPGAQDYLFKQITVIGQDNRAFPMRDVPVQFTVRDLAESAARLYPSARSAVMGEVKNARLQRDDRPLAPDETLLDNKFRNRDVVIIESVKFAKIRVLFIGASPRRLGRTSREERGEVRFDDEVRLIRRKAGLGHIELVREFSHAQTDDIREIVECRPDIIHLCCHGEDRVLVLEDEDGDARSVRAQWLADRLAELDSYGVRLSGLVVNACRGETIVPIFFDCEAARTVIGHREAIADRIALRFTENFYDQLSRMPILGAAASLAANSDYDEGEGLNGNLLILPPPPRGSW